ncbi:glutamine synthetase [Candidatus Blochmanniella floridana]|uniref:Glutamine synthetase n=1 Tax=Blochmanniella floridana TaxID=203907 RepID=Q7VRJ5_BLOFL|nr:glutamine synthetase [Candidatus Blochmannia floridanus]
MNVDYFISFINKNKVKFIDLRFTDIMGKEQHFTIPQSQIDNHFFENGKVFDGSSMVGWKNVHESDMILIPDLTNDHIIVDPFYQDTTVILRCDVLDPHSMQNYDKDPRYISKKSEKFLQDSGIADFAMFGPELEFFVFDDVRFKTSMSGCHVMIDDPEASWNSDKVYFYGNKGHRPKIKGGYSPVPPIDSSQNLRSMMSIMMEKMGLIVETHHHEVATAGQNEIITRFNSLTRKADEVQIYKYIVHNVSNKFGKTATFMPKPIIKDNGSGMHCHISLYKNKVNLFSGDQYGNLSEIALFYIGGILKHTKALNAITNPTTNSYKRLIPGYEAPTFLTYSLSNRSSAIRIPAIINNNPNLCRIEVRFPDPSANPYLAFPALLMAGIDGIINEIHPGNPVNKNLYTLSDLEKEHTLYTSQSLNESLQYLSEDYEFLIRNNVFSKNFIDSYILIHKKMDSLVRSVPHPMEFELYYSI